MKIIHAIQWNFHRIRIIQCKAKMNGHDSYIHGVILTTFCSLPLPIYNLLHPLMMITITRGHRLLKDNYFDRPSPFMLHSTRGRQQRHFVKININWDFKIKVHSEKAHRTMWSANGMCARCECDMNMCGWAKSSTHCVWMYEFNEILNECMNWE